MEEHWNVMCHIQTFSIIETALLNLEMFLCFSNCFAINNSSVVLLITSTADSEKCKEMGEV